MLHKVHKIFSALHYRSVLHLLFFVGWSSSSFMLSSCVSNSTLLNMKEEAGARVNYQKVYLYTYPSVWRAAQLTLKYPIIMNNMDMGIIETDWIRGMDGFTPPHFTSNVSSGLKYKLTLSFVKGKVGKRESVKVTIIKKIEKNRDFFSEAEQISSDGWEEKALFYRIERELTIEEALKKAPQDSLLEIVPPLPTVDFLYSQFF